MPVQFDDEPERKSPLEKYAPWLRRLLIGGCLLWAMFSVQTFSEDTVSHTIKVSYPLMMSHEKITRLEPGFDPQKAVWKPLVAGVPIADKSIFYVKIREAIYVVKIFDQKIKPESAQYQFVKVGTNDPFTRGTTGTFPDGVPLPGAKIPWSGKSNGLGYIYLDDAFIWNKTPPYAIGVPFQSGDENTFRTVPADVHFESVPWKIKPAEAEQIVPVQ